MNQPVALCRVDTRQVVTVDNYIPREVFFEEVGDRPVPFETQVLHHAFHRYPFPYCTEDL